MTETIFTTATVYGHGTIHVPVKIQKLLGLKDGDLVVFVQKGTDIVIRPAVLESTKSKPKVQLQEFGKD